MRKTEVYNTQLRFNDKTQRFIERITAYLQVTLSIMILRRGKVSPSDQVAYQGLHMTACTGCGPGCAPPGATAPLLRDWLSSLQLRLDLSICSLCCICGKLPEFWVQQFRQVGVTVEDMDCCTKSVTRWHASWPRLVCGSSAETRWRQAL